MTSSWNIQSGASSSRGKRRTQRRCIDGLWFNSIPKPGYIAHWVSDNKRVVLRQRDNRAPWKLIIDREQVGTEEKNMLSIVTFNTWHIKQAIHR